MRLVELDPTWLVDNGVRVGFTFISPTDRTFKWRQSCFSTPYPRREQWRLFKAAHATPGGPEAMVQGCKPECKWAITGGIDAATFETLTVTPSLDGSAGGLWYGSITNGEIVGGI